MKFFWFFRKLVKRCLGDRVYEWCGDCGRECEGWVVSDEFWIKIIGKRDGLALCLSCFARRVEASGLYPVYHIFPDVGERTITNPHIDKETKRQFEERLKTYNVEDQDAE